MLPDQVRIRFIHSGLSRANGMPRNLKEETYCCLKKCRQKDIVVELCNYLFFQIRGDVSLESQNL